MRRNVFVLLVSLMTCLGLTIPALAEGVRWAGNVDVARPNILHAPDDRITPVDPAATLSDFSPTFTYPRLMNLLRVSPSDWGRADVIAFEGNGGHGAGAEGGIIRIGAGPGGVARAIPPVVDAFPGSGDV